MNQFCCSDNETKSWSKYILFFPLTSSKNCIPQSLYLHFDGIYYISSRSCENISSILHILVYLRAQLASPHFPLTAFGSCHPLSTMKHFALCAIGSGVRIGRHPRGHINSTVRTKPPSCQFPSASIPGRRDGEGARVKARGWGSLEKGRKEAGEGGG